MSSSDNAHRDGVAPVRAIGLVVHPSRNIDVPLQGVFAWGEAHGVTVGQVTVRGQDRVVADPVDPGACDLLVSIGGDGTMLAAIRSALITGPPVMGVSCGSLGALTLVAADAVGEALDRFAAGDWEPRRLPAIAVTHPDGTERFALNDIAVVRGGIGQVRIAASVDGSLFSRLAGDGCIVATPAGSSAYSFAAGGPLLAPGTDAFLLTPLPTHGGSHQPLVMGAGSMLLLEVSCGLGGARLEIDGQLATAEPHDLAELRVTFRRAVASLVTFSDGDSLFESLRRRNIIVDSPRMIADDARAAAGRA